MAVANNGPFNGAEIYHRAAIGRWTGATGGKGERPERERREREKSNRGWIYGDRVQPVVFCRDYTSSLPGERINLRPSGHLIVAAGFCAARRGRRTSLDEKIPGPTLRGFSYKQPFLLRGRAALPTAT